MHLVLFLLVSSHVLDSVLQHDCGEVTSHGMSLVGFIVNVSRRQISRHVSRHISGHISCHVFRHSSRLSLRTWSYFFIVLRQDLRDVPGNIFCHVVSRYVSRRAPGHFSRRPVSRPNSRRVCRHVSYHISRHLAHNLHRSAKVLSLPHNLHEKLESAMLFNDE